MYLIFSKILLFIIKPIFWIFLAIFWAVFVKNQRRKKQALILSLSLAFFFSNNFIIKQIAYCYENTKPINKNIKFDVGIVLGGFSGLNKRSGDIAFSGAADRFLQTLALYKKGTIKKIMISSGNANLIEKGKAEADLAMQYLKLIGIPDSAILIENRSKNTLENAKFSIKKLDSMKLRGKILVITSAWHLPRTKLCFDRFLSKGQVAYYPTDYISKPNDYSWNDFIPTAEALNNWEIILREWVGYITYRIKLA